MNWLRLIIMILGNIYNIPYYIFTLNKYYKNSNKYTQEEKYSLIRDIAIKANKKGRIEVEINGNENLPKECGYLICPNHQGYYDTLAIMEAQDKPFGIVIKKKYSNIILVKQVISILKGIPIDTEDMRDSMKVIKNVSDKLSQAYNFLIFPEGTRSHKGNNLLEMKAGAFKAATIVKAPIVPVALIDCFKPFDEKGFKKVKVSLTYLEPLYYEEYKNMKTIEIAKVVKDRIQAYIDSKK